MAQMALAWVLGHAGMTSSIIGASVVLTARSDNQNQCARIAPAASDQLGIGEVTLLVVRPDGHLGLRADNNHLEALATEVARGKRKRHKRRG